MKIASISETKNQLSALLDKVRHGETILIMDRNHPVARLEPVSPDKQGDSDQLARLEREGVLRRTPVHIQETLVSQRPPKTRDSLLKALLSDREEGR